MRFRTRPSILALATVALLALPAQRAISQAARTTTSPPEHLTTDTPKSTVGGTTFVAPADWNFSVRGIATVLEPPEGDSHIALIDVHAPSADSAVALAWTAYLPHHKWPLKVVTPEPDNEGWSDGGRATRVRVQRILSARRLGIESGIINPKRNSLCRSRMKRFLAHLSTEAGTT